MIPHPTPIYHITHIDNLTSIVAKGGLGCANDLRKLGIRSTSVANPEIQLRRAGTYVPCGPGGRIHDYVPFFFAPRPPMLYVIARGSIAGYVEGQRPIVYLVTTVQAIQVDGRPFAFTDGHSIMTITNFYDDAAHLDRVDWQVMQGRYWFDTESDPDRSRRRQAEFLVYRHCPWRLVQHIAVIDREIQARVESNLVHVGHKPPVLVRPAWY